jgi:esterase
MTLNIELVRDPSSAPSVWIFFLHGILGTGANFRSFARKLVAARPTWGAVLIDLRMHGGSRRMSPPHTIAAAAADLVEVESKVPGPVRAVLGHSFGGKVALAYLDDRARRDPAAIQRLFLLDSNPGLRPEARGSESTIEVLTMLRRLPATFATRRDFIERVKAEGQTEAIAQWLAMNLARTDDADGFRFAIDLDAVDALLADYFARDLWSVLEPPPGEARVVAINGGKSKVYDDEARARLQGAAARFPDRLAVHTLEGVGHWIHVEAFEATFARVLDELPATVP